MTLLPAHDFHASRGATFAEVAGGEVVAHYGDPDAEHRSLTQSAVVLDLSFRSRLVLLGRDRQKMLNGQVTNNVKDLPVGQGCYAALVNAKARMLSDLNIYALQDEVVLDFEPGLTVTVTQRLEKFILGEDVQVVDAAPHYGLWSIQGPRSESVLGEIGVFPSIPDRAMQWVGVADSPWGSVYLMNQSRAGSRGFDLYVPSAHLVAAGERLSTAVRTVGGRNCGWDALEVGRVEAGIPRYGADMDESNLPPETGIEARAISYSKGCYSGQEVIARIRTYGQVAKALRGLRLPTGLGTLPARGTRLFREGKEMGYLTTSVHSPRVGGPVALGYVRREANGPGTELSLGRADAPELAIVTPLPFVGTQLA